MIINADGTALVPAASADKQREHEHQSESQLESVLATDDLPPYTPTISSESSITATSSTSTQSPQTPVPNLKPVNFLYLSREYSPVKGHFVLDPTLSVPSAVLPPLGEGQTELDRKHLSLKSETSSVNCEVWIVCADRTRRGRGSGQRRTSIQTKSAYSSVTVKIHRVDTPFILNAKSATSSVTVCIPRSFRGPVLASTENGTLRFSSALTPHVTLFSDLANKRQGFIGEISGSGWGESDGNEWDGDELVVKSGCGSVSVSYVDEPAPGILSWIQNAFS